MVTLGWTIGIQRLTIPPTGGTPAVPMLGASTVAHTSRDSPSVTALPPDGGGGGGGG